MTLVSWAKKEVLQRLVKSQKRLHHLPRTTLKLKQKNQIVEVVLDADVRCKKCQERVAAVIASNTNMKDIDSITVHVLEKTVTLMHKTNQSEYLTH
ncbi:hypothetical protein ACJIZ3_018002 [Penstemon smallii]|uniref:HMA domain-containing protein n=1 Tax=Penstemon smallii TaxID=265156 RepID=A0ABD3SXL2_9LAMI